MQAFIGMITAWTAVSCSSEPAACGCGDDGSTIPVSFTMNTPAGEAVPYGTTRATHDEAEWTIHRLTLYVYSVDDAGRGTFLRRYATDASGDQAISIVSNGAGTYNFTLKAPVSDLKARQRFVFVANDAFDEPSPGESQDELENKLAGIVLEEGHSADKLAAKGTGIAMSGIARSNSSDVVTITPGVKCEVSLRRIVARVDVQNNTPNLVISSIELLNAAPRGYLFPHDPVAAASESYITEAMNAEVALGTTYDEQKDLKKVFYLYERHNEDGNGAEIKITYTVNSSKGEVVVPFRKTSDTREFVDVERNTLYTVVLGNGDPVTTNEVKFSLRIEDWNVVDMDEAVDPDEDEQMKRNKALKVNMFTPFNAKNVDPGAKKINAFYDKLAVSADDCPPDSYFTYTQLKDAGMMAADAVLTDDSGNEYRLPTEGELNLLLPMYTEPADQPDIDGKKGRYHPWWNDNASTNTTYVMVTDEFTETIYLKNGADNLPDQTHPDDTDSEYTLKGQSQMKVGALSETVHYYTEEPDDPQKGNYNIYPVYALRFKGTSQYAAYRWETCKIADNPLERYLSIKIKALEKDDTQTTIDQVAQEAFWKDGFIEFKFPASGYYSPANADNPTSENITSRGVSGCCWSSSLWTGGSDARYLGFGLDNALVSRCVPGRRFPLRFVKVSE
ncbi:Major fimbrial subunit protein (FimA) [Alistipes finegoldii]|nr:Major fimbrial subunit protein (FimA) [Alistipes finegoldii]